LTSLQNFAEIVLGNPSVGRGVNARGVAKYGDVGHVENFISETVKDTASGNDYIEIHTRRIQWYHLGPCRVSLIRVLGPKLGESVYISEVCGAKKFTSAAQVAINKISDGLQKYFSLRVSWGQCH